MPEANQPKTSRKLPRWLYLLVFIGVVALALSVGLRSHGTADREAIAALVALGAEPINRPLRDEELDLLIQKHDGTTTTLRALMATGDAVILHFWASWCGPCMQELPEIGRLAQTLKGRRVQVVSVSHDDAWPEIDAALAKTNGKAQPDAGVWLREIEGQSGEPNRMLRVHLGTELLPETYVLQDGQALVRLINSQPWADPKLLGVLQRLAPPR
jgi:thiol-disulfide isomerase/thioredoxin